MVLRAVDVISIELKIKVDSSCTHGALSADTFAAVPNTYSIVAISKLILNLLVREGSEQQNVKSAYL